MNTAELRTLLRTVLATAPEEIDCDAFLERVAAFLEHAGSSPDLPERFQAVAQHLQVCPECLEEFEALLRFHEGGA